MLNLGSEVVVATRNAGKVKELEPLFRQRGIAVKSLLDYEEIPEIIEDGDSFAANALIKARAVALRLKVPAIADDSGLCVDRLGGEPGVYSARYAGEPANDEANNRKLLERLSELPAYESGGQGGGPRVLSPARFVSAIVLVDAEGRVVSAVEGSCKGQIIAEPRGDGGFGYDPLFFVPGLGKTTAELSVEQKNEISHRGQAIRALWSDLERMGAARQAAE
ncbi:XTP/dITP diphosphatase [Paenibacillus doosanensis]|uniref:XTP/dITP diphosphatase n=1 Tax=Paenibacillus doosanensis TaxID=1229154 RepID=UPI002180012A|nr:XTP/dITP diphosphatase [Paenibacillus doosanensis]MCS7458765.1 XTP/dITP diphosphatase [Paenibacillus doosanensis]